MKLQDKGKNLNGQTFRHRLLFSIFRIAAPLIAIICAASILMLSVNYRQTAVNAQSAAVEKVRGDIEHVINNTEILSRDLIFNNEIQQLLSESTAGEQYPQNTDAAYHVNGFLSNRDYINCVILTGNNQTLYSTEKAFTDITDYNTILHSRWMSALQTTNEPYLWFIDPDYHSITSDTSLSETGQELVQHFMLARPVYSLSDYTSLLGYLMIYLDDEYIENILNELEYGKSTNTWLADAEGNLLLKNESAEDYTDLKDKISADETGAIVFAKGQLFITTCRPVTDNGLYIYTVTPFHEVSSTMIIFLLQSILLSIAMVGLLFFLTLRTASSLSDPIKRLARLMDEYRRDMKTLKFPLKRPDDTDGNSAVERGGNTAGDSAVERESNTAGDSAVKRRSNYDTDFCEKSPSTPGNVSKAVSFRKEHSKKARQEADLRLVLEDPYSDQPLEILQIYRAYQQMVERIDTLIRENFIKNLEKKDAELALLQSQINPHFLYNTLDSINWMAIANDEDEISEMVTALSDMFRLSLTRSNSPYIRLDQEIEYVRSFLLLQKFRYQDCLDVNIDLPKELSGRYVPRFILQPLVENAIKHGITSPDDPFGIDIQIFETDDALHIYIGNDGTSISLEEMHRLLDFDVHSQELLDFDPHSYGTQNIHRRIQILCGLSYGLSFFLQDGRTYCDVCLPIRENDETAHA